MTTPAAAVEGLQADVADAVLTVRDLRVTFAGEPPVHAVRGVDLDVHRGERFALVGESGSGKTTTMLAIMGLLPKSAAVTGAVVLAGEPFDPADERRARLRRWRDVAIVFQGAMSSLNPVVPIGAQVVEPMLLHRTARGRRAARARALELLDRVGVPSRRAQAFPHQLSGGMRQRVAIAVALACEPKLVIADEPTTALDTVVQAQVFGLLSGLCAELGVGLLLVTHDLPVVMQVCGRAAVMLDGLIAEVGDVEQLYLDPRHPYTRRLLDATPDLRTRRAARPAGEAGA